MEIIKKIKKAVRGLTFSVSEKQAEIGSHYRYLIDKTRKEVVIIPDENGSMTVSRKKSGKGYKPLYDIRSAEVKNLIQTADYMEVISDGDRLIVRCLKSIESKQVEITSKSNIIQIGDLFGVETAEFEIRAAVGHSITPWERTTDDYFNYLCTIAPQFRSLAAKGNSPKIPERKEFTRIYDVVSLFSGAGLLDYAFRDPQFRFVFGCDFDKDAAETYRHNIGDHMVVDDIRNISENDVPDCALIIGGPCCQAYSNANRNNIDTEAGKSKRLLIDDYIRIVKAKQPDVFVIENVPQFLTKEQGRYYKKVLDELSEYEISATVVKDDEVGGYSIRKRAIVIGSKIGKIELPKEALISLKTVRDALSKIDATWMNYNDVTEPRESTVKAMRYVPQGGNWQDCPDEIKKEHGWGKNTQSSIFRRLAWDKPSPTIVNWRKTTITHPEENRILTVSEAAAIMGLDKDFPIYGSSLNARQQQVANGVTQAIGKFVKKHVLNALNNFYKIVPMPAVSV